MDEQSPPLTRRDFLIKAAKSLVAMPLSQFPISTVNREIKDAGKSVEAAENKDYLDFVQKIIDTSPSPISKSGEINYDVLGWTTRHGQEQLGSDCAFLQMYRNMFRRMIDKVPIKDVPEEEIRLIKLAGPKAFKVFQQMLAPGAMVDDFAAEYSLERFENNICWRETFRNKLVLPDSSPAMQKPDPEKLLKLDQVMGFCATFQPMHLGKRLLVYHIAPDQQGNISAGNLNFVGVAMVADVANDADQQHLQEYPYTREPWQNKPLPWIADLSNRFQDAIPDNGNAGGGRPGVITISEDTYRKYHPKT